MLPQERMIERLRDACRRDERVLAAMLYGSFPLREADRFSDIDCMLYFEEDRLPKVDQRAWVEQIAPVDVYYTNEFGIGVAIFANLVRGEFHFDPAGDMAKLEALRGVVWFPSLEDVLLVDRTGRLAQHLQPLLGEPPRRDTPDTARYLCHSFLNWTLFGTNVLARGERARALEILKFVHDHLLRMVRLEEGTTRHWITPTRTLEREISTEAYTRFVGCTAGLESGALEAAYVATWRWGQQLMSAVAQAYDVSLPDDLIEKLDRHLGQHVQ